MNISDINSMTYQAIWEYNKGKEIKFEDIKLALEQKKHLINQINSIFKILILALHQLKFSF